MAVLASEEDAAVVGSKVEGAARVVANSTLARLISDLLGPKAFLLADFGNRFAKESICISITCWDPKFENGAPGVRKNNFNRAAISSAFEPNLLMRSSSKNTGPGSRKFGVYTGMQGTLLSTASTITCSCFVDDIDPAVRTTTRQWAEHSAIKTSSEYGSSKSANIKISP
eukprot:CAMPEP_0206548990 /NCGR_PEP_ID=MMETSP0325_2-20121206/14203_1 /ASSEMBLY_ACC=CAM_ASM_000347 /TAXON_ID=2866 /ORGANISM="Crypthecodinium cohnii, Strain Seligo" /LENGTH=169 /DNA_ID=CAMNT_0054048557 /DNA_START=365 /DNA_END=875 /DNA_ORIENTATION=-